MTRQAAPPPQSRLGRRDAAAAALAVLLLGATWVPRLKGPIDLRWDAATYYVLGTSLFEGHGYRYPNEPGNVQAVNYPPLLPAIVAAHQAALGTSRVDVVAPVLRWSFLLIWAAYIAITFVAFKAIGGRIFAFAGTCLVGLQMSTIWLSDRLYADVPFALAATAFLAIAWHWPRRDLLAWSVATAAFLLRTAGVALFAGWIADALLARRWSVAARRVALALLPVLAWQGYIYSVEHSAAYVNPPYAYARADYSFYNVSYARNMLLRDPMRPELGRALPSEMPRRVATNLASMVGHLGEAVSLLDRDWVVFMSHLKKHPVAGRLVPWRLIPVSLFTFGAFVVAGAVLLAFTRFRLLALVLAAYILLLALLPTTYLWSRYLAGLTPFIAASFLAAVGAAARAARRLPRSGPVLSLVPLAVSAGAFLLVAVTAAWYLAFDLKPVSHSFAGAPHAYRMFTYDDAFAAYDRGLDWLRPRVRPSDVLVTSMPHWAHLRTGANAVIPPFEARAETAWTLLASVRPRFAVIDSCGFSPARVYALPAVATHPSQAALAWQDDRGLLQVVSFGGPGLPRAQARSR